ncbi:methane monooxygenase/ammonia monooxygenase subunit C [Nitrosomonas sp. JL21]|uniref:methane monooxygenase/ammonia monooxygenase subunit C n=1 Tax=Nitrosomonas sp. JL21 TaxID=153949 RepID=UPI001F032EB3|nr:methane monooxygenase/ammonia monooxygenase subunit C [Nitrosomonas sp. JL21]
MEELFSAPLHWGFVILGWAGLFSGGIAAQIITRYSNLTDVIWNNQSKEISITGLFLNPACGA